MRYLKRFNEGIDGNSGDDDKISTFIERFNEIMGGEFDILYNLLAGSGKIQSNY